jgi:hypothetical protein
MARSAASISGGVDSCAAWHGIRATCSWSAAPKHNGTTRLDYSGELGTDFGTAGRWWADRVAAAWEAAVRSSFTAIRAEAERHTRPGTANL